MSDEELIEKARLARLSAHAPYSHFKVGAALLTSDGRVFTGCNIENSTYGLSMCAERVAIFKGVSEGMSEIAKIVVVTDSEDVAPPCGCCRQMTWEFGSEDTEVVTANLSGEVRTYRIKELLPKAFDSRFLEGVG
ncbi:MAG: cytidine deaminase [Blastocatellia bacterium AA13]|nr:MAG: cytidine deaminase [Blastocatellia bacterium AA13]